MLRKYIIYIIVLSAVSIVILLLTNKSRTKTSKFTVQETYTVQPPHAFYIMCNIVFVFWLILFIFFLIPFIQHNPTVSIGHIIFAIVFSGIGLTAEVLCKRCRIDVSFKDMVICRPFHVKMRINKDAISKIERGNDAQMIIFEGEKKNATVGDLAENYDILWDELWYELMRKNDDVKERLKG